MDATIFINGVIGEDSFDESTSLKDVKRQFGSFSNVDAITVYVNSVGGDVREGFAIRDYLRSHGKPVTTIGEGKIYSIATIIFLAGDKDKRFIRPHAEILIHNPVPSFGTFGDADEHEKALLALRAIEDELANFYATNTQIDFEEAKSLMKKEARITGEDAITKGFASSIMEEMKAVAIYNLDNNLKDMSTEKDQNEELKGLRGDLNKILSFFKNEEKTAEPPKVEPEKEKAPDFVAQLKALKTQLAEKDTKIEALEKEKEAEAEKVTSFEDFQKQTVEVLAQVQTKFTDYENQIEELKREPILKNENPRGNRATGKQTKTINYPPEILAKLNKIAANIQNKGQQ